MPRLALPVLLLLTLAGCGTRPVDRTLSGAGVGSVVGTAAAVVVGVPVLTGVLVGAGTGAVIGAVTDRTEINLGRPLWRR